MKQVDNPRVALDLAFSPYSVRQCGITMEGATVSGDLIFLPVERMETVRRLGSIVTLEAILDETPNATIREAASFTRGVVELQRGWEDVTDQVADVMERNVQLAQRLPNDYSRTFELLTPGQDDEALGPKTRDLTVRKTSKGELLLSTQVIPEATKGSEETAEYQDWEFIYFALFDTDGKLKSTSISDMPYVIDMDGNVVHYYDDRDSLLNAKNPFNFGMWHQYAPLVREMVTRDSEGMSVDDLCEQLAAILTTKKHYAELGTVASDRNVTLESVLGSELTDFLTAYKVPRDTIPSKLPNASVYKELNFSGVDKMCDALERWGVPYIEVEYTAGVRQLNPATVDIAIRSGALESGFDWLTNILPPGFKLDIRNRNDIYYLEWVEGPDGTVAEKRTLLYDGTKYSADLYGDHDVDLTLKYPDKGFTALTQTPLADVLNGVPARPLTEVKRLEVQPTAQHIKYDTGYTSGSIVEKDAHGHIIVTVGDRVFDLTDEGFEDDVLQVMKYDYTGGSTPTQRYSFDRLTVEYHRDSDGQLVPKPTAFERRDEMHYVAHKPPSGL